jgi:hypothetical protein
VCFLQAVNKGGLLPDGLLLYKQVRKWLDVSVMFKIVVPGLTSCVLLGC